MTIENRSPEPIETVSEDYRHELDEKEEIARLLYNWRFGDILGEHELGSIQVPKNAELSCLALAGRILEVMKDE